jgi:hypothetical protein
LLAREDQSLLVWGNTLFILDLRLNVVDSVRRLDFEGYGFAREGLDEAIIQLSTLKFPSHHKLLAAGLTSALKAPEMSVGI